VRTGRAGRPGREPRDGWLGVAFQLLSVQSPSRLDRARDWNADRRVDESAYKARHRKDDTVSSLWEDAVSCAVSSFRDDRRRGPRRPPSSPAGPGAPPRARYRRWRPSLRPADGGSVFLSR